MWSYTSLPPVSFPTSGAPNGLSYWELAGALVFIGICAATFSEPEHIVALAGLAPTPN
jgi:hypothetical protein